MGAGDTSGDSTIARLEAAADFGTGVRFVGSIGDAATTSSRWTTTAGLVAPDPRRGPGGWRSAAGQGAGAGRPRRGARPDQPRADDDRPWLLDGRASRRWCCRSRCGWGRSTCSSRSTRARIRHGDAKLVLIDDQLADFYTAVEGDPPIEPMQVGDARRAERAERRRTRTPTARSRPARDPAVHERVDERAEGRDDPRSRPVGEPRRGVRSRGARAERGHGLLAAALPRHGTRRFPRRCR